MRGKAGCVSDSGADGACRVAPTLAGASDGAISRDGRFVYVTGSFFDAVTVLTRDAKMVLLRIILARSLRVKVL